MNQEWYCTSESNRPVHDCAYYFHLRLAQEAVTQLFCTTMCGQVHWTRLSLLQVKFCSEGKPRLQSRGRRLVTDELTCAYQVNQK